ncbi:MAG TPA: patatin-like phospholipase family protein [Ferrovibrio sp.]|uniref:patatin-like phospholipase family protein n=1 Tax=Ferrovibrio sp. TaxID=1917215 RepID=UPI002ED5395A
MTDPAEKTVLVLQGGGALGAYQAGAYEALDAAGYRPDWLAGISIGAINSALIAGNPPERRLQRLKEFWDLVSSSLQLNVLTAGDQDRQVVNEASAFLGSLFGVPGFFAPRVPPPLFRRPGSIDALSYYDTAPLKTTLERLVDFDYLNEKGPRLSVGAVEVDTGNFTYFDSETERIGPEHVMASGALPPGLPPIKIGEHYYWDGGLVSNTPLNYVLEFTGPRRDSVIFQVDLFNARGGMPTTIMEVAQREKEIRYSSRTRLNTNEFRAKQTMRRTMQRLLAKLPPELYDDPDVQLLEYWSCDARITIAHLIYRRQIFETHSMDYEFSRRSVEEHWAIGHQDVVHGLDHADWRNRSKPESGVAVFDLTRNGART